MGVVYKSFDPHIRRPIALKTIRRDLLDDDGAGAFSARFRNEAQAAGRLLHPGIVAVYEYGEENEFAYIAMEYVEGSSLRHYFEQKVRFGIQDVISIMSQLLESLQYAHDRGVWHRDIKPANIIIMSNGRVKIADFGIARVESSTLTQIGAIMGTPGYIAPELYLSTDIDCRIDVFAAGVVCYQLFAGVTPFGGSPEGVMYKVCYETPVPPSVAGHEPSLECFDSIVLRAMSKRAQDRYASAALFREALMQAHAHPVNPAVSEETIIREPQVAPMGRDARESSSGSAARSSAPPGAASTTKGSTATPPPSTATLMGAGWDLAELGRIEQELARFIGPVAKIMVRRATIESKDLSSLVHRLADQLGTIPERTNFLKRNSSIVVPGPVPTATDQANVVPGPSGAGTQPPGPPTAEEIALAARLLAVHVGPIAQILAKRAAQPGVTRDRFLAGLATHVSDGEDRERFLGAFG